MVPGFGAARGLLRQDWLATLLISFFVGWFGIDRFYLGYTALGILKLITFGGCGIWYLVDLILIAMGKLRRLRGSTAPPHVIDRRGDRGVLVAGAVVLPRRRASRFARHLPVPARDRSAVSGLRPDPVVAGGGPPPRSGESLGYHPLGAATLARRGRGRARRAATARHAWPNGVTSSCPRLRPVDGDLALEAGALTRVTDRSSRCDQSLAIASRPRYGRSTSGTSIEPSGRW